MSSYDRLDLTPNPITKAYVLLFVVVFISFFADTQYIIALLVLLLIYLGWEYIYQRLPIRWLLRTTLPITVSISIVIAIIAYFEFGTTEKGAITAFYTILRFVNIVLAGALFTFTTEPSEIIILSMSYNKPFGITVAAAISSVTIMYSTFKDLINIQRLRGISPSITNIGSYIEAITIPLVMKSIELSEDITLALKTKQHNSPAQITVPPHLKFKIIDYIFILTSTFLIVVIYLM